MDEQIIRIRDLRQKEKFVMDDEYMNGYARLCGWQATITYNSLCRHANKDQFCFPSIELMAEENGVGRDTIMKGLRSLQDWNIIQIEKLRTPSGTWKNNAYVLIDKSQWKEKSIQVGHTDMDQPSRPHRLDQVGHTDTKETHIKETHIIRDKSLMAKTPHGNTKVNFLLEEFTKRFGFPPTDSKPRNEAWNLSRRIDTWIKGYGKEPTEEMFRRASVALFDWIEGQDWGDKVQLLGTIRRKSVIFLKPKEVKGADSDQETA